MFQKAFKKHEGQAAKAYLDLINPELERGPYPDGAQVLSFDLPFYKGFELVEITDHGEQPPKSTAAVIKENEIHLLDWTNGPIYKLNEQAGVSITKDNVAEFVKFFFAYVAGRHGRFLICESVDDVAWKDEPAPAARKAIAQMIKPVTLIGQKEDGGYDLRANMMFKDSLFESAVHVSPSGLVSLSDEELLVENMPVVEDHYG